jgi:vacuolar protein sorting-associated protein 13D
VSLTLIDDSGERDIPLIEVESKELCAEATESEAKINSTFVCCIFNQKLSLWEPLIEPLKLSFDGARSKTGYRLQMTTHNRLNMNLTENLLFLHKDYLTRISKLFTQPKMYNYDVIRKKFRPYTLQNRTGMPLAFSTSGTQGTWHSLEPDQDADFHFSRQHEKIRNYQQKMHRLWLKVEAWLQIEPVTVNKVGTFFRHGIHPHKPPIRIVIEVNLTSSARKLVILRSAFQIVSKGRVFNWNNLKIIEF